MSSVATPEFGAASPLSRSGSFGSFQLEESVDGVRNIDLSFI